MEKKVKSLGKKKIYWFLQVGGWSLFALVNIVLTFLQKTLSYHTVIYAILISGWFCWSTHLFRIVIIKKGWLLAKVKEVLLAIFMSVFLLAILNFFVHLFIWYVQGALDVSYDLDAINISVYNISTFCIYLIWTLIYFIYHYLERYNTALKYEALKNEIELSNLKSQLNPHFIFNALNSIRALVDEDPEKSKNAITQLSHILRSSLDINKEKLTRFEDEYHTVTDYLALEKIRYEERLQTRFKIDPASRGYFVPPLMIQTLVENGIKHGIAKLKEGGIIALETKVQNEYLYIKIINSGQIVKDKLNGNTGLGLENTRQRLTLLYGNNATFKIKNREDNSVQVEIKLPKNTLKSMTFAK